MYFISNVEPTFLNTIFRYPEDGVYLLGLGALVRGPRGLLA